jgi:hypothetical protein
MSELLAKSQELISNIVNYMVEVVRNVYKQNLCQGLNVSIIATLRRAKDKVPDVSRQRTHVMSHVHCITINLIRTTGITPPTDQRPQVYVHVDGVAGHVLQMGNICIPLM